MADHDFTIVLKTINDQSKKVLADEAAAIKKRVQDHNAAARAVGEAARKEAEDKKKAIKDVAAVEDVAEKGRRDARGRFIAQNKEIADGAKKAGDEVKRGGQEAGKGWEGLTGMAGGFLKSLTSIGLSALGLGGISAIISMISESFERARKQAEEATKFASGYREALKEIAFLSGKAAPDADVLLKDIDFRRQTTQNQAEARGTQEGFLNAAAIAIDTKDAQGNVLTKAKMTQEEANRAQVFAGQMQARVGGSGEAFGLLAGSIPSMEGKMDRVDDKHIARRMSQMFNITSLGIGSPADFAKSLGESGGLAATGAYSDPARLAVMQAAISLSAPTKVAHGTAEINRMISGGRIDPTGAPGSKRAPSEYLKSIGVTDQDDDLTGLMKMIGDVEAKKADYEKQNIGKEFPLGDYIKEQGYGNITDINVFKGLYAHREDIRRKLMPMADIMPTMEQAGSGFETYKESVSGREGAQNVDDEHKKLIMGGGAGQYAETFGKKAFESLQTRNKMITGTYEDWKNSNTLRAEMIRLQEEEWKKSPLDHPLKGMPGFMSPTANITEFAAGSPESNQQLYESGYRISQAGGSPMGKNTAGVKAVDAEREKDREIWRSMEQQMTTVAGNSQPAPIQVAVPGGENGGRTR